MYVHITYSAYQFIFHTASIHSHTKKKLLFFQKGWNRPNFRQQNHFQKSHEITIVRNVPPLHHALLQLDHLSFNPPKCHGPWLKILGPTGPPTRTFQFQPGIRFCQHAIVEKGKTKKPLGSWKCASIASLKPAMEGHQQNGCNRPNYRIMKII